MAKSFIEIDGHIYNLDMLVDVKPIGPQGTDGYKLKFCNGSYVEFKVPPRPSKEHMDSRYSIIGQEYRILERTATAIRMWMFDRTIPIDDLPYRDR